MSDNLHGLNTIIPGLSRSEAAYLVPGAYLSTEPGYPDHLLYMVALPTVWENNSPRIPYRYTLQTEDFPDVHQVIFRGSDFRTPAHDSIGEAAVGLLGFLTLRPGDTDPEYFTRYEDHQVSWRDMYAEDLSSILYDENGDELTSLDFFRVY